MSAPAARTPTAAGDARRTAAAAARARAGVAARAAILARAAVLALAAAAALSACAPTSDAPPTAQTEAAPAAPARTSAAPSPFDALRGRLVAASAPLDSVAVRHMDPSRDALPADTALARRIQLGYAVFTNTPRLARRWVGNALACSNCHLNAGQRELGLPLVGSAGVFPLYRPRSARIASLEDRIRGCFARSEAGTPPPYDSEELLALSAYVTWLSEGQPLMRSPPWRGRNVIAREHRIAIDSLDPAAGARLFAIKCSMCHGEDGQGREIAGARPGPLWGPGSWSDGAGMARVYTMAGFIRYAMPLTAPGTLSDVEAQQIAAYVNSKPRPVFAHKAADWPGGHVPLDAVYYPIYPRNPLIR